MRGRLRQILIAFLMVGAAPAFADALDDLKAGLSEARQGNRDTAIQLLTSALEDRTLSRESRALALSTRAYAYQRSGDYAEAVVDYDLALSLAPDPIIYRNRGTAYLEWGQYDDAAGDFAKALSLQRSNAYFVMWLHVARLKAGIDDGRELTLNLEQVDPKQWPGSLLAYIAGRERLAEVTREAQMGDPSTRADRRCDMAFFLGVKYLAEGVGDSLRLLREARDICPPDSIERALARVDLLRLAR